MIEIRNLSKSFTLHNQGSAVIPVMAGAALTVAPGECVGLIGASGAGKSTLMRMVWGNYLAASGSIRVGSLDVATAAPRQIIRLRRETLGYVSQFLRVVPRVPTVDVVAEPLLTLGVGADEARGRAMALLAQLNIPERLWSLSPTTFSGGEQQRVAIARAYVTKPAIIIADEPTGNLDPALSVGIMKLLDRINREGTTVLMATHDSGIVDQMRKRVIELDGGHVIRDQVRGVYGYTG